MHEMARTFALVLGRMFLSLSYVLHYGPTLCVSHTPSSVYRPLYAALICGVEPPHNRAWELFVDTGLIHILVVSGAHLVFVERLVGRRTKFRLPALGLYCWLTGFGAPVLRAFARRLCHLGLERCGWSRLQVEAAATLLLLLVYPPFLSSRSFLMSWLCALALLLPGVPLPRWRGLDRSLKVYLFLFPFCPNSPLAILWNCLIAPFVGEILFPACLLAFVCPWFTWLSDSVWRALLWMLSAGPHAPPSVTMFWTVGWLWWLPLCVHVLLLIGERKWRRALAFL